MRDRGLEAQTDYVSVSISKTTITLTISTTLGTVTSAFTLNSFGSNIVVKIGQTFFSVSSGEAPSLPTPTRPPSKL